MKKLITILLIGLTPLLLLQVIGCEGISGPRGDNGDQGDQGDPYKVSPPANRYFSLAVGNNSRVNHNGAPKLYLAFDSLTGAAGDTVVCQRLASGQVPVIDGVDQGATEWGSKSTSVALYKIAGNDNRIYSALVRAVWDKEYVYFLVKWTEVADSQLGIQVGESNSPSRWVNPATDGSSPRRWRQIASDEDRLMLFFEASTVDWFDRIGCFITCHTWIDSSEMNIHSTRSARERVDVWSWGAASTNPVGFADDKVMGNVVSSDLDTKPFDGIFGDLGTPLIRLNSFYFYISTDTNATIFRPVYQSVDDPNADAPYPLWDYEITPVSSSGWQTGSTIPVFFTSIPSGSRADIVAKGRFDTANGTWTVELRRARITGNGDDAQF
jgi:hypothetical protein